jgi:hypothetical protein
LPCAWERALPAADLAALLVLPSRNTFEAAFDAFSDVVSLGALLCVSALAAAVFTVLLVEVRSAFEALFAALPPVVFAIELIPRVVGWWCGLKINSFRGTVK